MSFKNNPGLDPKEIEQLKKECIEAGKKFVYFEEELNDEPDHVEEFVHVQFVGNYEGFKCVIAQPYSKIRCHVSILIHRIKFKK